MRRLKMSRAFWVIACVNLCLGTSLLAAELRAWGADDDGQASKLPAGADYAVVAAGDAHGLALRPDGTIVAWGQNDDGECNVPAGAYKAVGAGADFSLAVRTDGTIAAWGNDAQGQISRVPAGKDFVAVDGGEFFAVALMADGSIVAWGNDRWRQVSDAPKDQGFTAVVAGDDHAVALRSDGSVVSWGYWGATEGAPVTGTYTAIGAGGGFSLALKNDGSIVWWGNDPHGFGLANVPAGNDYVAIAAGYMHCLALKKDGSVVGWGAGTDVGSHPHWGQAKPPAGNSYEAIAGGLYYSLALTGDTDKPPVPPEPPTPPEPPVPPTPPAAVISDDFNDDQRGDMWRDYGDDLLSCWLEEVNQRLEIRSTAKAAGIEAFYLGHDGPLDPTKDFSFKVDFHYSLVTDQSGWVLVGLTPDVNDLNARYVKFGAGCDKLYPYFWYAAVSDAGPQIDIAERSLDDGVLYVSYDAALDELYLSDVGYGAKNAWGTIKGLLQASWRGGPVHIFLGGGANGLELNSGAAYLDNFAVGTGDAPAPPSSPIHDVYRFWSPVTGRYFYTIDETEKDTLIREYPDFWTYEGPVFKAATTPDLPELAPVYRFWSPTQLSHFYTISEDEKNQVIKDYPHVWTFETVAFYAYPEGQQPKETKPVYRFWNVLDGSHFYTIDESEKDKLIKELADVYILESIAFYTYE